MAPSTRNTTRPSTPDSKTKACVPDSVKKTRFFQAYDRKGPGESCRSISKEFGINHTTGSRWLQERETFGSPAYRTKRKKSMKLGRRSKISKETCRMLVSPSRNPVRDQTLEAQIAYHDLPVKRRQLTRKLNEYTNEGQIYKMAYIKKDISHKNEKERTDYGNDHQDKTIDDFWQYIIFLDEAHYDPSSTIQGSILRKQGHRYDTENIQQRGKKKGNKLYFVV
jgi:transposase